MPTELAVHTLQLQEALLNAVMSSSVSASSRPMCDPVYIQFDEVSSLFSGNAREGFGCQGLLSETSGLGFAFAFQTNDLASSDRVGTKFLVDGYGGRSIGRNGGSGRAGFFGAFHVKGIGKTPLVGNCDSELLSDGRLSFLDCLREVLISWFASLKFPSMCLTPAGFAFDREEGKALFECESDIRALRTLLIRPKFARLAHFEPAYGFAPHSISQIEFDLKRVELAKSAFQLTIPEELRSTWLINLGRKWGECIARQFIECIDFGIPCTSNIDLFARYFDFGAVTAVPSWRNCATTLQWTSTRNKIEHVQAELEALIKLLLVSSKANPQSLLDFRSEVRASVVDGFKRGMCESMMEVLGQDEILANLSSN